MFSKRVCHVRSLDIGGDNPVRVQTMYDSSLIGADMDALITRIGKLSAMGCDLIRFSYSSLDDAPYFSQVAKRSVMPVVADIHFDYRLALSALESGAVAFVQKPQLTGAQTDIKDFFKALLYEIRLASKADVSRLKKLNFDIRRVPKSEFRLISSRTTDKVIVMGASTGGTTALTFLLKQFPSNMPGTVIVQHMPPGFTARFAERLNDECSISVREAKNGDIVKQGEVLIAPGGLHLKLVKKGRDIAVETFDGPRLHGVIPSVDYLFSSAADVLKERAVAVILTGMGDDGAKAMAQLRVSGAYTIAQDKETSLIYGMPAAAVDAGGVTVSLPLDKITEEIIRRL